MDARPTNDPIDHEPILDPTTLEKLRELGRRTGKDIFRRLVMVYLEQSRERIEALRRACRDGDRRVVQEAVHSLKGTSGNLGAMRLSRFCMAVERRLETDETLAEGFALEVVEEYERVVLELRLLVEVESAENNAQTPEHVLAALRQIEEL